MTAELTPILTSALVSIEQARNYCHAMTDDDTELRVLLAMAEASVRARIGRQLEAAEIAEKVHVGHNCATLNLTHWPVVSVASITDPHGHEVPSSYFREYLDSGMLATLTAYEQRVMLTEGEWTVTYTGGMDAAANYATTILPRIRLAVLLTVADVFENRNARASSEAVGSGIVTMLDNSTALPPRAEALCAALAFRIAA